MYIVDGSEESSLYPVLCYTVQRSAFVKSTSELGLEISLVVQ